MKNSLFKDESDPNFRIAQLEKELKSKAFEIRELKEKVKFLKIKFDLFRLGVNNN